VTEIIFGSGWKVLAIAFVVIALYVKDWK